MHATRNAQASYERAAYDGRDNHRHALYQRLNCEAHGAALFRQRVSYDREDGRACHAVPCHCEGQADEDERPGGAEKIDGVSYGSQGYEEKKCASSSPAICEPAARILIDSVEEIFSRAEKPDRWRARA